MAKMIKFNLTLSGATVSNFDELQDNFSADILPIYRTGRLLKWLQARELTEQAQAVQAITPSDDERELLGALCRALDLDDDAEVITFLLEDWQASQERQAAAQAAPATPVNNTAQSTGAEDVARDESATSSTCIDWSGQNMCNRNFEREDFRNGRFVGTDFSGAVLTGTNFSGADLSGAKFGSSKLNACDFSKAVLTDTIFVTTTEEIVDLTGANFVGAKFNKTIFCRATIVRANFSETDLSMMKFEGCDLYMSNFDSADLSFSDFSQSTFHDLNPSITETLSPFSAFSAHSELSALKKRLLLSDIGFSNFSNAKLTGITGLTRSSADEMTVNYLKEVAPE